MQLLESVLLDVGERLIALPLSQFGKFGMTAIGNNREEAERLFTETIEVLDRETGKGLS